MFKSFNIKQQNN